MSNLEESSGKRLANASMVEVILDWLREPDALMVVGSGSIEDREPAYHNASKKYELS